MFEIKTSALKDEGSKKQSEEALAEMLEGIVDEWALSRSDLAAILVKDETTIRKWFTGGRIPLKVKLDRNDLAILAFIDFYNHVSSVIVTIEDQKSFFKVHKSRFFDDLTPLEFMKVDAENVVLASDRFDRIFNP